MSKIVVTFMHKYGYAAIFVLMALESATLPVPSEVVLPLAGLLAANGTLNFYIALVLGVVGSIVGSMVDYTIGYYLGKELIYKHLHFFHIKKHTLDNFDSWFNRNGEAAVLISRLLPVVRTVVNFPAGFAKMDLKRFLGYSLIGIVIWDTVLMLYGYYLLSSSSAPIVLGSVGLFALILYIIYRVARRSIK